GGASVVAAGDAICRARAAAGGLPNAGAYRAWLSNDFTDAYCHVQGLGGKRANDCLGGTPAFAGPWYRSGFPTSQPATGGLNRLATSTRTFATTASRTSSRCSGTASNRATRIAGRPPCRDSRNGVLPFSPVNSDRRNRR